MPYASRAQQGLFHSNPPPGITPSKVKEYDEATKGHYGSLPQHAVKKAAGKAAKRMVHAKANR